MSYGTLELPSEMIAAAESYAQQERVSLVALFAKLLNGRYGYETAVPDAAKRRPVPVPDSVKAISGIIGIPKGKTDDDLIREAIVERYMEIS